MTSRLIPPPSMRQKSTHENISILPTDDEDADVSTDLDVLTIPDEDTLQSLLNTLTPPLAAPAWKLTFCILRLSLL